MAETTVRRSLAMPPQLQMLTLSDVAVILGVSRRLVSSWIQEGVLPAMRLGPGQRLVRVSVADLEAFLAQSRQKGLTLQDFQAADRALAAALAAASGQPADEET